MLIRHGSRPVLFGLAAASLLLAPLPLLLPLSSSSGLGFWCGVAAALLIGSEFVLSFAKRFRGAWIMRYFRARWFMLAHLVAGLAAIPLSIIHSNWRFGGPLTAWLMLLFLVVSASGVWGMLMQQVIPRRMLDELPEETVSALGGIAKERLEEEAVRLVAALQAVAPALRIRDQIGAFQKEELLPFLRGQPSALRDPRRAAGAFTQLAEELPAEAQGDLRKLETCAEARRQLDRQRRLEGWLHGWLVLHVPLSFALLVLLVWHILAGLKFW
ncbi:MAG: hypothetical protein K2W96_04470 [Gemmataceae bacterium]|nr:hypothetical protein [Gemmataceae bacterium]